jgi:hypothetical protein
MPNQNAFNPSTYHSFADIKRDSPFWQRLDAADGEVRKLQTTIESVAEQAFAIARQIVGVMPTYTLHDERHLLNLIAWMERLMPKATVARLSPLEVGLCFLAAFTHDLGMALPAEERRLIDTPGSPARRALDRHAERFPELVRRRDHLPQAQHHLARHIEEFLVCDYLRATHAGDRLNSWLEEMKKNGIAFQYAGVDYQHDLQLIGNSHNQPVSWLRHELGDRFYRLVRTSEYANFALPGLLLRLADIMDFDRSRTPPILYQHLGLDDAIGIDWTITRKEWAKHLAIDGIDFADDDRLRYVAGSCPSPVIEKSIREFVGWIQQEVAGAREELRQQSIDIRRDLGTEYTLALTLPASVEPRVNARRDPRGKPIYSYHDLQFQLAHDEIIHLLMGEQLYGDPGLCIRELLQNALDAVELREKRLQLVNCGEQPAEAVDGFWHEPGSFSLGGAKRQRLAVSVSWGHDAASGHDWITVEDNGIGMSEEVLTRYFTRIGKSYYRSAEFRLEQNRLREHGIRFSPISQFGIGFLSCFMLADRVEVRTHPGAGRPAHDVILSGPANLFWLKPGTRAQQGTEVKLILKTKFNLAHAPDRWLDAVRQVFGYPGAAAPDNVQPGSIDPAYLAARYIVWPRYPILLASAGGVMIDDRFHIERLAAIDVSKVHAKGREWGLSNQQLGTPRWQTYDWEDREGPVSTGTRIRVWYASNHEGAVLDDPGPETNLVPANLLASLVETQYARDAPDARQRLLVRGMLVDDTTRCDRAQLLAAQAGAAVWIDLRGDATPELTADRRTARPPEDAEAWERTLSIIRTRWLGDVDAALKADAARRNMLGTCLPFLDGLARRLAPPMFPALVWRTPGASSVQAVDLVQMQFHQERAVSRRRPRSQDRDGVVAHDLEACPFYGIGRGFALPLPRAHSLGGRNRERTEEFALGLAIALGRVRGQRQVTRELGRQRRSDRAGDREHNVTFLGRHPSVGAALMVAFLQEAFFPDLRHSWPPLGLCALQGMIGDGALVGPAIVDFTFEADGRTVRYGDGSGTSSAIVQQHEYDLVFPLSVIPLGNLRQRCAVWRQSRDPRRLGVLPFLVPSLRFTKRDARDVREYLQVKWIYALMPRFTLWQKPFAEWTAGDWNDRENLSVLWDLQEGAALWARGTGNLAWIRTNGLPAAQLLEAVEKRVDPIV